MMTHTTRGPRALLVSALLVIGGAVAPVGCTGPVDAPVVELPVEVLWQGGSFETTAVDGEEPYHIELEDVRIAIRGMVFTIAGELHGSNDALPAFRPSRAFAHPGHYQGGDVTGEMPGRFIIDWTREDGRGLGQASLIAGTYEAANFVFDRADETQLDASDVLIGHTAYFSGTASRGGVSTHFAIAIDSPIDRELVGVPFEAEVSASDAAERSLAFEFHPVDDLEGDTFFDGVDFEALDQDGDGELTLGEGETDAELEAVYNLIRRIFQTHDHYRIEMQ